MQLQLPMSHKSFTFTISSLIDEVHWYDDSYVKMTYNYLKSGNSYYTFSAVILASQHYRTQVQ